jgi:hypothetical protein
MGAHAVFCRHVASDGGLACARRYKQHSTRRCQGPHVKSYHCRVPTHTTAAQQGSPTRPAGRPIHQHPHWPSRHSAWATSVIQFCGVCAVHCSRAVVVAAITCMLPIHHWAANGQVPARRSRWHALSLCGLCHSAHAAYTLGPTHHLLCVAIHTGFSDNITGAHCGTTIV